MRQVQLQGFVLLASVAAFGCGQNSGGSAVNANGSAAETAKAQAAQALVTAPVATTARPKFHRHGGLAARLFRAIGEINMPQAQQASFDKIEANLKAGDDGMRSAMTAFHADLGAGIKAGKLDSAKLTADNGLVDQAIASHKVKEAEALDSLHGLLDAAQRTSLVASVRAKQAEHEGHVSDWMKAKAGNGEADWSKKHLEKLTADLGLDTAQQTQVAAMLTKTHDLPNVADMQSRGDERKSRTDALLSAFASETFEAKNLDLNMLPGKTAHEPMDHLVTFASQLLPILHPDQLPKFAGSLERPFGAGGHGGAHGPDDDVVFPFAEPIDEGQPPAR